MKTNRTKTRRNAIPACLLLLTASAAHANEAVLARLAQVAGRDTGRVALVMSDTGRAFVSRLLGARAAASGRWSGEELAQAISRQTGGDGLQEEIYYRLRFIEDRIPTGPRTRGIDLSDLGTGARQLLTLKSVWTNPISDLGRIEFVAPELSTYDRIRESFSREAPAAAERPSRSAEARAMIDEWMAGPTLTETESGQALLARILATDPTRSAYRSAPSWPRAFELMAAPAFDGFVIDFAQRLDILNAGMSGIHPSVGEPIMNQARAKLVEKFLQVDPDSAFPAFRPISDHVPTPRRRGRWDFR